MSESAKQTPLGVNVLGSILGGVGLNKNTAAVGFMGESFGYSPTAGYVNGGPYTLGSVCESTTLRLLTHAINQGYIGATVSGTVDNPTYNNLINIGAGTIPAFGNSKPPTFDWADASGYYGVGDSWAPTGWGGPDQYTRTNPADPPNPVTAWGFIRLLSLQAWNEFNYNNSLPEYQDFLSSFMTGSGFIDQTNPGIIAADNSKTYLSGVYSNMDDLTTADIAGVNLATVAFGQDLIKLGRAIDLSSIDTFGMPSNLLQTLQSNNAVTDSLVLALLSSGITTYEMDLLLENPSNATTDQEKNMYAAYTVIGGQDLQEILIPLNCKTVGIETLADLLDPSKLFPNSYQTLTVPLYNEQQGPTNSKTYYFIYNNDGVNSQLFSSTITSKVEPIPIIGQPQPQSSQVSTVNLDESLQQLQQNISGSFTPKIEVPTVTSYTAVTTSEQSATLSVVGESPVVKLVTNNDSIASGEASSAFRPGKPFFQTEEK